MYTWHDSFMFVSCLVHMSVTCLFHVCDMTDCKISTKHTRSNMMAVSHMSAMQIIYMRHASCMYVYVTRFIHICHETPVHKERIVSQVVVVHMGWLRLVGSLKL